MIYFRVISNLFPLVLVLGLGLRLATPVQAELNQWTGAASVTQMEDEKELISSPNTGQVKASAAEFTTPANEQILKSGSQVTAESRLSGFMTKLALDLGLIRQREEDAWSALTRVDITPVGGWAHNVELTPEVFYDVLAAARRAANAGHLFVSADGAEAIVRAAVTPFLSNLEEVPAAQTSLMVPEDQTAVASEAPVMFYEQAPLWQEGWQSGLLAAPVVVIGSHRLMMSHIFHRHHVFLPCPSWRCRQRFAPFGFPAVRPHVFAGPRFGPPPRVGLTTPRFIAPPISRIAVGPGSMHMSGGRMHGGFLRR